MEKEDNDHGAGFSAADETGAGILRTWNSIRMGSVCAKAILACSTYIIFQQFGLCPMNLAEAKGEAHPLLGRIYSPPRGGYLSREALLGRMKRSRVIYLGELHDNPEHHSLQLWVLKSLIRLGSRPAVSFEMFTRDVSGPLLAHLARPGADLSEVPALVGWEKRGWPAWSMYAPLVEAVHGEKLSLIAADLPYALRRRISLGGGAGLPPELAAELNLGPPDPAHKNRVLDTLFASHCRVLPKRELGGLYLTWRARNRATVLAFFKSLREGNEAVIFIGGAGHADRKVGIPADIGKIEPGLKQFSLAFVEVQEEMSSPEAYLDSGNEYDAVWFTARHEREDPCVKYGRQLERLRRKR